MIKIGVIGLVAVIISFQLSKDHKEFAFIVSVAAGLYILGYGVLMLTGVVTEMNTLLTMSGISEDYVNILMKCLGITYIGEFAAGLCKDAGHASIGEQIEMVAKLSILALSMPVLTSLISTIYSL